MTTATANLTPAQREAEIADVHLRRRVQQICTWCGPGFVVLLFGGWGLLGGFIPLIPPGDSAAQVAHTYATHQDLSKAGLVLGMIGVFLTVPFFYAISTQLRRSEGRIPQFAILQFASGLIVTVVLMIPMLLFLGGAFRPERLPELTRLVNELSYLMLILPWPPIWGQLIAIAMAIFTDRRETPVFPRWLAYLQVWVAFLLLPATLIEFFDHGPFAWNGAFGFWLPAAVFGLWYVIMTPQLLRAVREEAEEELAALGVAA